MGWLEHIDYLTTTYPQEQFRVPYTTWPGIFRKIEEKFIIKKWTQYIYRNWLGNLKREVPVKTIPLQLLNEEFSNLDPSTNYWVIIVYGNMQDSAQYVYDCNVDSMKLLVEYAPADFFIADKRYEWLTYFKINPDNKEVVISKSGEAPTPFDM